MYPFEYLLNHRKYYSNISNSEDDMDKVLNRHTHNCNAEKTVQLPIRLEWTVQFLKNMKL